MIKLGDNCATQCIDIIIIVVLHSYTPTLPQHAYHLIIIPNANVNVKRLDR